MNNDRHDNDDGKKQDSNLKGLSPASVGICNIFSLLTERGGFHQKKN